MKPHPTEQEHAAAAWALTLHAGHRCCSAAGSCTAWADLSSYDYDGHGEELYVGDPVGVNVDFCSVPRQACTPEGAHFSGPEAAGHSPGLPSSGLPGCARAALSAAG